MRKKTTIITIGLFLCVASFFAGRWSISREVITYWQNGGRVSFQRNMPTFGIPITEYVFILSFLRSGRPDEAVENLELFLDLAADEAISRRPTLKGASLQGLDKCLINAAKYREHFPRLREPPINPDPGIPNTYWTPKRQAEIDAFLRTFATNAPAW